MGKSVGKIAEVFKSTQGEGLYQGIKQVFVRFFGCNLKCRFCDTKLSDYKEQTAEDLMAEINRFDDYHSLSITGGEPLLQVEFLKDLLTYIRAAKKKVYLETNGTLAKEVAEIIDYLDIIAMDFKLPSTTGLKPFWEEHKKFLKIAKKKDTFIKAVIGTTTMPEDIYKAIELIKAAGVGIRLILQPEDQVKIMIKAKLRDFEKICRNEGVKVKVIPQIHKEKGLK